MTANSSDFEENHGTQNVTRTQVPRRRIFSENRLAIYKYNRKSVSATEIASALNLPESTVRRIIKNANIFDTAGVLLLGGDKKCKNTSEQNRILTSWADKKLPFNSKTT
ncbi:hypothetical protein CDIK_2115 [Cucumispora dikerogammari]|nr:hypothetical protein CDIK_2115 [Cucumispora dikerogammari]